MRQALDLTESVFAGTAKDAAATMADLKQMRPEEASEISLGELQYWASVVRPSAIHNRFPLGLMQLPAYRNISARPAVLTELITDA